MLFGALLPAYNGRCSHKHVPSKAKEGREGRSQYILGILKHPPLGPSQKIYQYPLQLLRPQASLKTCWQAVTTPPKPPLETSPSRIPFFPVSTRVFISALPAPSRRGRWKEAFTTCPRTPPDQRSNLEASLSSFITSSRTLLKQSLETKPSRTPYHRCLSVSAPATPSSVGLK